MPIFFKDKKISFFKIFLFLCKILEINKKRDLIFERMMKNYYQELIFGHFCVFLSVS